MAGHSESSDVEVPLGTKTEIVSASQVVASALTFAKRYAFNAFGILTGDEDNDSQSVAEPKSTTQSKPSPAKPVVAKPYNPKVEIVKLLKKLGVNTDIKDKEKLMDNYKAVVLSSTGLDLVEQNYTEIINRLHIRIEESAAAQKQ
jgi:hypothetical protein